EAGPDEYVFDVTVRGVHTRVPGGGFYVVAAKAFPPHTITIHQKVLDTIVSSSEPVFSVEVPISATVTEVDAAGSGDPFHPRSNPDVASGETTAIAYCPFTLAVVP